MDIQYLALRVVSGDEGRAVLHLEDCVLAEVYKALHLLLVSPIADCGIEECLKYNRNKF